MTVKIKYIGPKFSAEKLEEIRTSPRCKAKINGKWIVGHLVNVTHGLCTDFYLMDLDGNHHALEGSRMCIPCEESSM